MKGNIGQLMKQAQQMQENMRRMQESLATTEVEGQSGAGMVKVQMTCKYDAKRGTVEPSLASVRRCEKCNNFSEEETCALCRSPRRDRALLCVVETPADLAMVEQTLSYSGMYFVLMGRLSPLDGVGPRDIGLDRLLARAADGVVQEVILATNFTNEGEATAHYIAEMLRARGIRATRIARGVPLGGELEYVDVGTISQALLDRHGL